MDAPVIQMQIAELNRKLDLLIEEIGYQKRRRLEMEDLKADLNIVAKDLYQTAIVELEDLSGSFRTEDVVYLFKTLLRNTRNLTAAFQQLESLRDFVQDFGPITKEVYKDALARLQSLEQKGYFEFASALGGILDTAVASFSREDLEQLRSGMPRLAALVRQLTRPEVVKALAAAVAGSAEKTSLLQIWRVMNSPDGRRGLAMMTKLVQAVGQAASLPPVAANKSTLVKE